MNLRVSGFGIRFKNFTSRFLEAAIRFYLIRTIARFMSKRDAVKILVCGSKFCAETEIYLHNIFVHVDGFQLNSC